MNTCTTKPSEAPRFASPLRDERGLSTVEYVVLLVLIVAASVGLWVIFGGAIHDKLTQVNATFEQVTIEPGGGQTSAPGGGQPSTPSGNANTRPLTTTPAIPPAANNPASGFAAVPATGGPASKTKEDR